MPQPILLLWWYPPKQPAWHLAHHSASPGRSSAHWGGGTAPLLSPQHPFPSSAALLPGPGTDLGPARLVTWCLPLSESSPSASPTLASSAPSCQQWHWRGSLHTVLYHAGLGSSRKASWAWCTPGAALACGKCRWAAHPGGSPPVAGAGSWWELK